MTATSKDEQAAMPVEFKLNGKDVAARARVVARRCRGWFHWPSRIHLSQFLGESPNNFCPASLDVVDAVGEGSAATSLYCIAGTHGVEVTAEPLAPPFAKGHGFVGPMCTREEHDGMQGEQYL
jgi:hypothetical protein